MLPFINSEVGDHGLKSLVTTELDDTNKQKVNEKVPGVIIRVPFPIFRIATVCCIVASHGSAWVIGHCIQVIHGTTWKQEDTDVSTTAKGRFNESINDSVIYYFYLYFIYLYFTKKGASIHLHSQSLMWHHLYSGGWYRNFFTHRFCQRQTPWGPDLSRGSWQKWTVCWFWHELLRSASDLSRVNRLREKALKTDTEADLHEACLCRHRT